MKAVEWTIVRELPDGRHELSSGKHRMRVWLVACTECGGRTSSVDYVDTQLCVPCTSALAERATSERRARLNSPERRHLQQLLAAERIKAAADKRAQRLRAATPPWSDLQAISEIYRQAREKTAAEGEVYHVDHIWPLYHPTCCGLHVSWNLRVIARADNCAKGYKLPLDKDHHTMACG